MHICAARYGVRGGQAPGWEGSRPLGRLRTRAEASGARSWSEVMLPKRFRDFSTEK